MSLVSVMLIGVRFDVFLFLVLLIKIGFFYDAQRLSGLKDVS
jgi:hypothetical protein